MERLTASDFDGPRLRRAGDCIVCFAADWCPFCRRFVPEYSRAEGEVRARLAIADVADESSPLWEAFGIEVIPLLVGFRDGVERWRIEAPLGVGLGSRDLERMRSLAAAR
jgi:thioredoxin 1